MDGFNDPTDLGVDNWSSATIRKIAKGSKKNPSLLFRKEVSVSLAMPKAMTVTDLSEQ